MAENSLISTVQNTAQFYLRQTLSYATSFSNSMLHSLRRVSHSIYSLQNLRLRDFNRQNLKYFYCTYLKPITPYLLIPLQNFFFFTTVTSSNFSEGKLPEMNLPLYTPGKLPGENTVACVIRQITQAVVSISWKIYGYIFVPITVILLITVLVMRYFFDLRVEVQF